VTDLSARQAAASRQGREFEQAVETWLKVNGHQIVNRRWVHPEAKVEIDFVTHQSQHGVVWVEACGSYESNRNGLERTDTLLKKLVSATVLRQCGLLCNYWLVASHPPRPGSAGEAWMALAGHLFDRVRYFREES